MFPRHKNLKVKAKLSLLVALNRSTDHLIYELRPLLSSESFTQEVLDIPAACASIFKAASESVTSLPALKKQCKEQLISMTTQHWDNHLRTLSSSEKVCRHSSLRGRESLVEKNHEKLAYQWSAVIPPQGWLGYPPNPMNLRRMRIQHGSQCPLCSSNNSHPQWLLHCPKSG